MTTVAAFDERIDAWMERWRGTALPDGLFRGASHLGDFSVIWHLVNGGRALIDHSAWKQSLAISALLGVESLLVNQGVKRVFRRQRPTEAGDHRLRVRRPSTSSFPSGHASAAFFSAGVLTTAAGAPWAALWYPMAAVVGTSRAYVRIHHASDVVGGALIGAALGLAGSAVLRAWVM